MLRCFLRLLLPLAGLALLALGGCKSRDPIDWIPPMTRDMATPKAFQAPELAWVRRVVLLPTHSEGTIRESERAQVDAALRRALQRLNQFETIAAPRDTLRHEFGKESFSASALLPAELLPHLHRETVADAVLFVEITAMSSYPPLNIGLKARLEALPHGGTLWAFDHFFDGGDPNVAATARRASEPNDPSAASVLLSPSRFAEFVTESLAATLTPTKKRR